MKKIVLTTIIIIIIAGGIGALIYFNSNDEEVTNNPQKVEELQLKMENKLEKANSDEEREEIITKYVDKISLNGGKAEIPAEYLSDGMMENREEASEEVMIGLGDIQVEPTETKTEKVWVVDVPSDWYTQNILGDKITYTVWTEDLSEVVYETTSKKKLDDYIEEHPEAAGLYIESPEVIGEEKVFKYKEQGHWEYREPRN